MLPANNLSGIVTTQRLSVRQHFDSFTRSLTTFFKKRVVTFGTNFDNFVFSVQYSLGELFGGCHPVDSQTKEK